MQRDLVGVLVISSIRVTYYNIKNIKTKSQVVSSIGIL